MGRPASVALKSTTAIRAGFVSVPRRRSTLAAIERMVPNTESADAGLQVLQYNLPTGTRPGVRHRRAEARSAKGAFHVRSNRNVKALRVVAMAARQDAKRLDLISYALVFLLIAVAAEAIVAALIW